MDTQWCVKVSSACRGELQARSPELHRNKSLTVFSWDVGGGGGGGGGGLFGVSERGGVMWVQGSHSLGEKAVEQSGGAGSDTPVPSTWG